MPKGSFFPRITAGAQTLSLRCLISFKTVLSLNLGALRSTALNSEPTCLGSNSINSERRINDGSSIGPLIMPLDDLPQHLETPKVGEPRAFFLQLTHNETIDYWIAMMLSFYRLKFRQTII